MPGLRIGSRAQRLYTSRGVSVHSHQRHAGHHSGKPNQGLHQHHQQLPTVPALTRTTAAKAADVSAEIGVPEAAEGLDAFIAAGTQAPWTDIGQPAAHITHQAQHTELQPGVSQSQAGVTTPIAEKPARTRRALKARKRAVKAHDNALVLHSGTGLPLEPCKRIIAAQQRYTDIPKSRERLQERVQQLIRLMGPNIAAAMLKDTPRILARRPDVIALHCQELLAFFSEPSSDGGEPQAPPAIVKRLLGQPNLLAQDVEKSVGNLYEMGIMLQANDLHEFAGKALKLALMRPATMQQKLRSLLTFLNEQPQPQKGSPQRRATASLSTGPFTYQQLQQATRKDHRWLHLATATIHERLLNLETSLKISREDVGKLFLRTPAIANKKPTVIQRRIRVIQGLAGLGPSRAQAAILSLPALLSIREEIVQHRWQQLLEAAEACTTWRQQLQQAPASSIAGLLAFSQKRYDRLTEMTRRGLHKGTSLQYILRCTEQRYANHLNLKQQALELVPEAEDEKSKP